VGLFIGSDQVLSKLQPASIEEWNRPICIPKTRIDVINFITEWLTGANAANNKNVLWMHGLAGSGKSTISTTVAEMMRGLKRLGGFFYFDRNQPERTASTLIRTLAYQLAMSDPQFEAKIMQVVEENPNLPSKTFASQFSALLSNNALSSVDWRGGPLLLVIDALDECGEEKDRKILLKALLTGFSELASFLKVIIFSRPEVDIHSAFESHSSVYAYHLNINSEANRNDILVYLQQRLAGISEANKDYLKDAEWPGTQRTSLLADQAAGLFVWASTACLYIEAYGPDDRLDELLHQKPVATASKPFADLDKLYKFAIQAVGKWDIPSFAAECRNVLGIILCSRLPLTCLAMDHILKSNKSLVLISNLRCVIHGGKSEPVQTLHLSFQNYLCERCDGEPWSIHLEEHHLKIALCCIDFLDQHLHKNINGLSLNQHEWIPSLPEVPSSEALSYGCLFWIEHLIRISKPSMILGDQIYHFLENHLLHWIEALAVLKKNYIAIQMLQNLLDWLKVYDPT